MTSSSSLPPVILPQTRSYGSSNDMYVINRKNEQELVVFDEITSRISKLCYGLHDLVSPQRITQQVINGMYCGITTTQLDELAAQTCAYMAASHPDYSKLAARIAVDNLHKNTWSDIGKVAELLYTLLDVNNEPAPLLNDKTFNIIMKNKSRLNYELRFDHDFEYDYFGFKTLERSYLLKVKGMIVERPQHMLMRVSVGIHGDDIESAIETYRLLSESYFIHATPTLFNAGTKLNQLSSCFLLTMKEDSIKGIYETLSDCANISKCAGGIGLSVHKIRAAGSYIRGTNGYSNGLIPMLKVFNASARYVDQGGGKRKGAIAIYLEPWHADVFEFLELRKNHGTEDLRARDLFLALWISDLFMERVENDQDWTLMCPNQCSGLDDVYGDEFRKLYLKYENDNKGRKTIKARDLWFAILNSQIETGVPYILFKDSCNYKSNQKNVGTIKGSNLCTEIIEYSSSDEIAVCNLGSISLPKYVMEGTNEFNFGQLYNITKVLTKNLNKIIDVQYYPVDEAKLSNLKHRPLGIGVQGFADMLHLMRLPFESNEARKLNVDIFETIYFSALETSCQLAKEFGPYESYPGSPASKGILQFDLWNKKPTSNRYDWESLKSDIAKYGLRNSLLLAPMPTASTAQILGNCESFEPYNSNIFYRRCLGGEYMVVNPHLLKDLIRIGLWNEKMKNTLIAHNGSIQNISEIPDDIKLLYKTIWEIKQKVLIDFAADRGIFIDQSQSLNLHLLNPSYAKLTSMHFYTWKKGLKTGCYYLRTQAAVDPIKFTIDPDYVNAAKNSKIENNNNIINDDITENTTCTMCSG